MQTAEVLDDMQTQEELDDSISCVGTPTFPLQEEEQESEDGLPEYIGFGEMMRRKRREVILTMIVMSRLMMNFSRRELIHRFHP
jgi:hypothetical protein